jgi:hypothetical protein
MKTMKIVKILLVTMLMVVAAQAWHGGEYGQYDGGSTVYSDAGLPYFEDGDSEDATAHFVIDFGADNYVRFDYSWDTTGGDNTINAFGDVIEIDEWTNIYVLDADGLAKIDEVDSDLLISWSYNWGYQSPFVWDFAYTGYTKDVVGGSSWVLWSSDDGQLFDESPVGINKMNLEDGDWVAVVWDEVVGPDWHHTRMPNQVIPEPLTMSLLTLGGGVVFRRRSY